MHCASQGSTDPYIGWHGSFLNCCYSIMDSLKYSWCVCTLHWTSLVICSTHITFINTTHSNCHLPWNLWFSWNCCIQDSGHQIHVITNVMYLKGVFTTPHVVGHGCLHIQLYTVQAPHINRSENSLAVSTFLMTKKIDDVSYGCVFLYK
jgi:hypothetical protein